MSRLIEALIRRLNGERRRYGVKLTCGVCEAWMNVEGADEARVDAIADAWDRRHGHDTSVTT